MEYKLISYVIDDELFKDKYRDIFEVKKQTELLNKYKSGDIKHTDAILPMLNKENTEKIAELIDDIVLGYVLNVSGSLKNIANIVNEANLDIHNVISHIIISGIFQSIYAKKLKGSSGCYTVINKYEDCKVMISDVISLNENSIFAYWYNSLQESSTTLTKVMANKYTKKILQSKADNNHVIPYGSYEGYLVGLNILKEKRIKGALVPSYFLNVNTIDKNIILKLKKDLTIIGKEFEKVTDKICRIIIQSKRDIYLRSNFLSTDECMIPAFYVLSYVFYEKLIDLKLIMHLEPVKMVFGIDKKEDK